MDAGGAAARRRRMAAPRGPAGRRRSAPASRPSRPCRRRSRRSPRSPDLVGFAFGPRSRSTEGVGEGDGQGRRRARLLARARDGARGGRALRRGSTWRRRCAALAEELGAKPGASFSRSGSRSPGATVSAGIFESLALLGREESLAAAIDAWRSAQALTRSAPGLDDSSRRQLLGAHSADRSRSVDVQQQSSREARWRKRAQSEPRSRPRRPQPTLRRSHAAQRGPRPPPDRCVRGARGVPGAGGVAQAGPAPRQPGPALGRRDGDRDRVRRRARDLGHAPREQAAPRAAARSAACRRRSRCSRPPASRR